MLSHSKPYHFKIISLHFTEGSAGRKASFVSKYPLQLFGKQEKVVAHLVACRSGHSSLGTCCLCPFYSKATTMSTRHRMNKLQSMLQNWPADQGFLSSMGAAQFQK